MSSAAPALAHPRRPAMQAGRRTWQSVEVTTTNFSSKRIPPSVSAIVTWHNGPNQCPNLVRRRAARGTAGFRRRSIRATVTGKTGCKEESHVQFRPLGSFAAAAAAVVSLAAPAAAQTPEQFYGGKNIDFVIGYPPGGSNDTLGRLVARHIGKHIP